MRRLLITEQATSMVEFSRSYVLVLADGESATDYATEIADIEWIQEYDEFTIDDDLTTVEGASDSDLDEYQVVGPDFYAINAELEEIAAEESGECRINAYLLQSWVIHSWRITHDAALE